MPFSKNIKFLRENSGLSQTDIGLIAGVTDKAVSTWEAGTREPRMGAVELLAEHFNVSKSILLFGDIEEAAAPKDDGLDDLDRKLMMLLSRLSEDQKKLLLAQIEVLLKTQG